MAGLLFRKEDRLRFGREFREIARYGVRTQTRDFVLLVKKNNLNRSRLGVTVGKKVGKAVIRNRTKRLVREFFRLHRHEFPEPIDMAVIAKPNLSSEMLNLHEVTRQLEPAVSRLLPRILKK